MKIEAILWDLDGTLLDSLEDLADAANSVLTAYGCPTHPVDHYRYFVGDGVQELMRRILPESERNDARVEEAVALMKQIYAKNWQVKTRPYEGMIKVLREIGERNIPMAVFSNKPDAFTCLCVEHYFQAGTFAEVRGQGPETPLKPAPDGALAICRNLEVEPADCLYIGDTATDMKTAVAAGMRPVGALWGFRGREELIEAGAAKLLEKPADLLVLLECEVELGLKYSKFS